MSETCSGRALALFANEPRCPAFMSNVVCSCCFAVLFVISVAYTIATKMKLKTVYVTGPLNNGKDGR